MGDVKSMAVTLHPARRHDARAGGHFPRALHFTPVSVPMRLRAAPAGRHDGRAGRAGGRAAGPGGADGRAARRAAGAQAAAVAARAPAPAPPAALQPLAGAALCQGALGRASIFLGTSSSWAGSGSAATPAVAQTTRDYSANCQVHLRPWPAQPSKVISATCQEHLQPPPVQP